MNIAVRIIVKGRVQGVGYRWFAIRHAQAFDITGYVKNLPNGDVEVLAQGDESNVIQFQKMLRQGPAFARVLDLNITKLEYEDRFKEFNVKL